MVLFLFTACVLATQPAGATILTVTGMGYANPTTVHIEDTNPVASEYVYSGAFSTTVGGNAFLSWCIDIFKETFFGPPVSDYHLETGTAVLGQTKADTLGRLATGYLSQVNDGLTSGAFQLAAWEIVNETAGHPYSLSAGDFTAWGANDNSLSLAQTWLNSLPSTSSYSVSVWESSTHQNLAVFSVPEPESYTLTLSGLLLFAFARLRTDRGRNTTRSRRF